MVDYKTLTPDDPPIAFLDCIPLGPSESLVISAIWGLDDNHDRPTRLLHLKGDEVSYTDVDANVISLCRSDEGALALSKSGFALPVFPSIGEAQRVGRSDGGTMLRIRDWGDVQFACGMNGQISRRMDGNWSLFDEGIYSHERSVSSEQLRDIGGIPGHRLISVGWGGSIFEYKRAWRRQDVPSNASLEQIAADPEGRIWVSGAHGTLIRNEGTEWEVLDSGTQSSFWGMACYAGVIYLSSLNGLWTLDRDTGLVEPLDHGLDFPLTTYRLRASATELWSIGPSDILRYNGSHWHRVFIPSNG